mmetsp:Transcript_2915/g.6906  ORF Transcript_2915/g.6906 Transcript_2915/m.6906 type:complete len:260 (+) Transcript_2915:445-1224(+)
MAAVFTSMSSATVANSFSSFLLASMASARAAAASLDALCACSSAFTAASLLASAATTGLIRLRISASALFSSTMVASHSCLRATRCFSTKLITSFWKFVLSAAVARSAAGTAAKQVFSNRLPSLRRKANTVVAARGPGVPSGWQSSLRKPLVTPMSSMMRCSAAILASCNFSSFTTTTASLLAALSAAPVSLALAALSDAACFVAVALSSHFSFFAAAAALDSLAVANLVASSLFSSTRLLWRACNASSTHCMVCAVYL